MKIGAVIAEFNPFHTGHGYLIDEIRKECDAVIAVMSGNFVQRGECAIFDKAERTKMALQHGIDLVIELPAMYALSSAEGFAYGAVSTLVGTGIVDELWFGSECGDANTLKNTAYILNNETPEFKATLDKFLRMGESFPSARINALKEFFPDADILNSPNNILAVEYIRGLEKLSSTIIPRTVKRIGGGYNDDSAEKEIISASAVRKLIKDGKSRDTFSPDVKCNPIFMSDFDILISARVKTASRDELLSIPDCNIELSSRIMSASKYNTFDEIVGAASCKSYTQSRIRRILCNLLIGNRFLSLPSPDYIRILGFNKTGSEILGKMKSTASLPPVARGALLKDNPIFNLECRATDIYNLARGIGGGKEFEFIPFQIS